MRDAWILACKDFALFLRDRTGLLLSLALPIALATIFGFAMAGMSGSNQSRVKFLVEDLDRSDVSAALVAELEASTGLRVEHASDVRRKIADGKGAAALLIPSGFAADFGTDHALALKLYRDPGQAVEQQVVMGSLVPALARAFGATLFRELVHRGLVAFDFPERGRPQAERVLEDAWTSVRAIAAEHAAPSDGVGAAPRFDFAKAAPAFFGLETEDVVGGGKSARKSAMQSHAVSGTAVMMLLFGLAACGATLLQEREEGTLQRLQLSPASGTSILLGKLIFTGAAGMLQLVVLFTYGALVFDIPVLRDPLALFVHSFAVVCAATGLGLVLAIVCRTRKQLEGLSTLVILVMSALGGSWFPLIATPEWFQKLGHFTLNAWAMDGYQAILWYGKGVEAIWVPFGVLMGIAFLTIAVAAAGWKRRFEVGT